jgi:hypothetical protein
MVIATQNHETEYQICTQKFWWGGDGGTGSLYSLILKNCSNTYNFNTVYNCMTPYLT